MNRQHRRRSSVGEPRVVSFSSRDVQRGDDDALPMDNTPENLAATTKLLRNTLITIGVVIDCDPGNADVPYVPYRGYTEWVLSADSAVRGNENRVRSAIANLRMPNLSVEKVLRSLPLSDSDERTLVRDVETLVVKRKSVPLNPYLIPRDMFRGLTAMLVLLVGTMWCIIKFNGL